MMSSGIEFTTLFISLTRLEGVIRPSPHCAHSFCGNFSLFGFEFHIVSNAKEPRNVTLEKHIKPP